MLKKEIEIGKTYAAKVSGNIVPVRIISTSGYGGWNAVNVKTGRAIRIKSAAKLRYEVPTERKPPSFCTVEGCEQRHEGPHSHATTDRARPSDYGRLTAADFRVIADLLRRSDVGYHATIQAADILQTLCPHFDRARFLRAASNIGTDLSRIDSEITAGR